ncbi:hypothetical protein ACFU9F_05680 [Streptomyces zhihengii]
MTEPAGEMPLGGERGCLRVVLGVPLVLLHAVAAFCCWTALTIRPGHPGDEGALAGIELACLLVFVTEAPALLITLTPTGRRVLGRWWTAFALLLVATAAIRLAVM